MRIVLKRPIITEQTMKLADKGFFTFEVSKDATKPEISSIVAEKFKVGVLSVKTINVKPEIKLQRQRRRSFQTRQFKKAIVQLKKGQKIAMFETPPEEVAVTTAEDQPTVVKEKKNILRKTNVKVERPNTISTAPTTQRKVITGK